MKERNHTIKENIKKILEVSETSRNSDASLVSNYWYKWDVAVLYRLPAFVGGDTEVVMLPLANYKDVTSPTVIERLRRLAQEEIKLMPESTEIERNAKLEQMKLYYPTDPKVIRLRRLSSKLWKEYINQNKINIVMNS